jgi:hypothetical protein
MYTSGHGGNLSGTERGVSAGIGTGLSLLMLRSRSPVLRALAGLAGLALLARAVAGHCAVKAAVSGESSMGQGLRDEWNRMARRRPRFADAQEAVEEQANPAAMEEGTAQEGPSVSSSATARH